MAQEIRYWRRIPVDNLKFARGHGIDWNFKNDVTVDWSLDGGSDSLDDMDDDLFDALHQGYHCFHLLETGDSSVIAELILLIPGEIPLEIRRGNLYILMPEDSDPSNLLSQMTSYLSTGVDVKMGFHVVTSSLPPLSPYQVNTLTRDNQRH